MGGEAVPLVGAVGGTGVEEEWSMAMGVGSVGAAASVDIFEAEARWERERKGEVSVKGESVLETVRRQLNRMH